MIKTDVLVVGAGPAGLAAAIKLKREKPDLRVVVLEKGRNVGSHVLSGAIVDPSGFGGFLSAAEIEQIPCEAKVVKESFRCLLTKSASVKIPWVPPMMSSKGFPLLSLTKLVVYLADLAAKAGVEIYTGYAVTALIEENGRVVGARTGEKGLDKNGARRSNYLASEEIRAGTVVLAEGGCGILTDRLIAERKLAGVRPPTYAVGVKELIEVPAGTQTAGETMHTFGWPADFNTYGGGFVYHVSETQVMVGYAYALDYARAEIEPFRLFQRFKASSAVAPHIKGGKSVAYGVKVIPEGGFYAIPKTHVPGCLIVGDGAGLLDSLRIKGVHIACQSGVAAAMAIAEAAGDDVGERYEARLKQTPGWKEIARVRNVRAAFSFGLPSGVAAAALAWLTNGKIPWFRVPGCAEGDAAALQPLAPGQLARERGRHAVEASPVQPDRLTDVFMSGTRHEEDQPCHLKIGDAALCQVCEEKYGSPCTRFCLAEVYRRDGEPGAALQIDFSNCLHCKTCKIKCPYGNIEWTFPQGGDGPRYTRM
ncbi:MAG: 4Fe-4S dicluster domain-containing protein [Kiritimatiellia bacterium]